MVREWNSRRMITFASVKQQRVLKRWNIEKAYFNLFLIQTN